MADSMKGERATCACGAVGEIVSRSHPLDWAEPWFVIRHDDGCHVVERFWNGQAFRFQMLTG